VSWRRMLIWFAIILAIGIVAWLTGDNSPL
jgi:hypothetical protein